MRLDAAAQKLLIAIIILLFVILLVDLATTTVAVCEGCELTPLVNLLPALR